MSVQRVALGRSNTSKLPQGVAWHSTSPYKTRAELSDMLDDLQLSFPQMLETFETHDSFWGAFQTTADSIKKVAMGFDGDYVAERLDAMKTQLSSAASGRNEISGLR